jgi:hypothetical protein
MRESYPLSAIGYQQQGAPALRAGSIDEPPALDPHQHERACKYEI